MQAKLWVCFRASLSAAR